MEAKAKSITFLADEGCVQIPFFQRGYVWNRTNWEDMLIDLLEFNKSHFLGSLILKQQSAITGEPKKVLVIDGQQRLTTISILLKAIYDLFDTETQKNTCNELLKYLFYKRYATDKKYLIKINHSRIDSSYYKRVIGEIEYGVLLGYPINELNQIDDKSNRILQCYKYFYDSLKKETADTLIKLFNHLLNSENKIIVLIDLTEHDNEQSIFDTINSAGIRLSGTDIVKNALFQRAMELIEKDEVIQLYEKYWDNVFAVDDDSINFWGAQKSTGRLMRDNSEILLQTIAVIKGIFDPEEHTLSELPDLFKEKISSCNESEIRLIIEEISEYAQIYREFIPVFDGSTLFSFCNYMQRAFHILDVCEISTFHPYIIYLLKKYKGNDSIIEQRVYQLEKLIIQRMITQRETKSYNKQCKDFINDENSIAQKLAEITEIEIANGLKSISNKNATLLLFWIELYRRNNDNMQSVKELKYNYSLEHIMPQKWEEYWIDIVVFDDNDQAIQDAEQAKSVRYKRLYSLGNMTLLNTRLNTSLRNYVFERKIEGEGRKKGIRHYSELWITKKDIIESYDNGQIEWNEKQIKTRENSLTKEILEIWNKAH